MATFFLYTLLTLFIIVCFLLIMIVLIQKGRGGGLAGAFGGGGGGTTAFGAKTGDVLTWVTSIIFGVFLLLAIALNILGYRYQQNYTPRGPIAPVAPISQAPAGAPTENVPPLSTDSRPTNQAPTTGAPVGTEGLPARVTNPAPATTK
jgi:preprotein translocase subunit SecG